MASSSTYKSPRLSKSRIALFEQCPRRLWLSVHRPELAEESEAVKASFAHGHEIGDLACRLLPGGHMISGSRGLGAALDETAYLLAAGFDRPIFEATFEHDGVLIRADLLIPDGDSWHLAEVKNTAGIKTYHLPDIATQLYVMRGSGLSISRASIRHVNRDFVLTAEGQYDGLFVDSYIDAQIEPLVGERQQIIAEARNTLEGDEPAIEPGDHCTSPFPCSFSNWCNRDLPPAPHWPTSILPGQKGKVLAHQWREQGIDNMFAIPEASLTSPILQRIYRATVDDIPYHAPEGARQEIAEWPYPHIFLDFETIQFAIPRWIGTRPFDQTPFQFSAHVRDVNGCIEHHEHLSLDGDDPRRGCAAALAQLPATGAVIAWNASFERSCLRRLAADSPDHEDTLLSLASRVVDLLPVAKRHYYHRDMRGSWSIKSVLPALAPEFDYATLEHVRSGTDAQSGYIEAIDPATDPARREVLKEALLAYCGRDTEAMMMVMDRLAAMRNNHSQMSLPTRPGRSHRVR